MPVYEFCCEDCSKKFDVIATLEEKEAGLQPVCPHCGGMRVRQIFGRFTVVGGSKSEIDEELPDLEGEDYGEEGFDELGNDEFGGDEDLDSGDDDLDI